MIARKRSRHPISTGRTAAPRVRRVTAPAAVLTSRPSIFARRSGRLSATRSMISSLSASRSVAETLARTAFSRPVGVPSALAGDRPDERGGVVLDLAHRFLVDGPPARRDGMGGADVRRRRHGGDVRGERDERAGGRRPSPGRRHVDDDRHRSVQHLADDRAHRPLEPAGRVEQDHQRRGAVGAGALDRGADEADGDRADHPVDLEGRDRLRARGRGQPEHEREAGQEAAGDDLPRPPRAIGVAA